MINIKLNNVQVIFKMVIVDMDLDVNILMNNKKITLLQIHIKNLIKKPLFSNQKTIDKKIRTHIMSKQIKIL